MEIIEYNNKFQEDVKALLIELQEYVVSIDKLNLNIVSDKYKDGYFEKTYEQVINGDGKIFLCVENGKAIGMIAGHVRQYEECDRLDYKCPKMGVIEEFIVSKSARADGIGSKLIVEMENYFKSLECEFIMLDVFAYNENARRFYERKGYQERMVTLIKRSN